MFDSEECIYRATDGLAIINTSRSHTRVTQHASLPSSTPTTMSGFVETVRSTSEFLHASRSAYDDDGAKTSHGVLARTIDDLEDFFRAAGTVSIKDAPAYLDAIRNVNGVGLDDRQFLVLFAPLSRKSSMLSSIKYIVGEASATHVSSSGR